MSFVFTKAKEKFAKGEINLSSADMRMLIVMTNTTAHTSEDATTISGITTLDEFDGSGYARKTLAGEAVAIDNANDRAEFTFTAPVWTALGAGTRQAKAAILFLFVTNDSDSVPVAYIDTSPAFPFTATGVDVTLTPNTEGCLQFS